MTHTLRRQSILSALAPHQAAARRLVAQSPASSLLTKTLTAHVDRLNAQAAALCSCGCRGHGGCNETRRPATTATTPPPAQTPPAQTPPAPTDPNAFPAHVALTPESLDNVQRAPDGTRFYCMVSPVGEAHCAASQGPTPLPQTARSQIKGQPLPPLAPDGRGTGHQQVARAAGIPFDEASARVGYVEGEGFGFSLSKIDDCDRDYAFESAFNEKLGDRTLPKPLSDQLQQQVESAFPPCDLTPTP
jgi:hypothetical protein